MSTNQFRFSSTNLFSHLLFFIGIFSCIPVLRIGHYSIYVWLMALAVPLLIITGRFRMRRTPLMPLLFSACITFFFTYSTLPEAYGENNFKGLLSILLVFIVSASLLLDSKDSERVISGVLIAGKINIIWIFLQTIFWGILKTEMYYRYHFEDYETLRKTICAYIDFYNNDRYQKKLGCMTPAEFIAASAK